MRVVRLVGWLLLIAAIAAARFEFTPVASVVDTRLAAALLAAAALVLFGWQLRRPAGRRSPAVGAVAAALVALFAVKLLWFTYREQEVSFHNHGVRLAGTLFLPRGEGPFPAVVFIHGAGPDTRREFLYHAKLFARHGIAGLAWDKRGAGRSGGKTYEATYRDYAADAAAAVRALRHHPRIQPRQVGLFGHSEGGWVAPMAAQLVGGVAFVIITATTDLTPAEQVIYETGETLRRQGFPAEIIQRAQALQRRVMSYQRTGSDDGQLQRDLTSVRQEPWFAPAELPNRLYPAEEYAWWRSVMDYDPLPWWRQVGAPVLAISGGRDPKSDGRKSQRAIAQALHTGGNDRFTGRVFPRMEHGTIEWWLPAHLPPPRFPRGYPELLIGWTKEALGLRDS
ncbi:MAG TPA: alpha/beta hydrolase [Thermoanaerobaculia bacterium]|jgi:hypothetical protein